MSAYVRVRKARNTEALDATLQDLKPALSLRTVNFCSAALPGELKHELVSKA